MLLAVQHCEMFLQQNVVFISWNYGKLQAVFMKVIFKFALSSPTFSFPSTSIWKFSWMA
jgi:hypothetical protein